MGWKRDLVESSDRPGIFSRSRQKVWNKRALKCGGRENILCLPEKRQAWRCRAERAGVCPGGAAVSRVPPE